MSGLNNLKVRLNYIGKTAEDRIMNDKLRGLRSALFNSYQGETAILANDREFKCLINRDKLTDDYDEKIISIPFEDICLNEEKEERKKTSEGRVPTNIKVGDVFQWKENGTYWLVYLQRLEEQAYFRAEIKRCRFEIEINNTKYKVYFRGPQVESIEWKKIHNISYNTLNYNPYIAITNNEETFDYFHRHKQIKINGDNWKVAQVDKWTTEGIIIVSLEEDFNNQFEDARLENLQPEVIPPDLSGIPHIVGDQVVYPFDKKTYIVEDMPPETYGFWEISTDKVTIVHTNFEKLQIDITTSLTGTFDVLYHYDDKTITFPVKIERL